MGILSQGDLTLDIPCNRLRAVHLAQGYFGPLSGISSISQFSFPLINPLQETFLFVLGQMCNTFSLQSILVRVQLHRTQSTLTSFRKKRFSVHSGLQILWESERNRLQVKTHHRPPPSSIIMKSPDPETMPLHCGPHHLTRGCLHLCQDSGQIGDQVRELSDAAAEQPRLQGLCSGIAGSHPNLTQVHLSG